MQLLSALKKDANYFGAAPVGNGAGFGVAGASVMDAAGPAGRMSTEKQSRA
jgi:hypothetical protein